MAAGISNEAFSEEYDIDGINSATKFQTQMSKEEKTELDEDDGVFDKAKTGLEVFIETHKKTLKICGYLLLNLVVVTYVAFAGIYWHNNTTNCDLEFCNGFGMLLIIIVIIYSSFLYYSLLKKHLIKLICSGLSPLNTSLKTSRHKRYLHTYGQTLIYFAILLLIIVFLIFDTAGARERWISFGGILLIVTFGWIFSKHPNKVNWKSVSSGLIIQILFGLFTIRWSVGRAIFQCISNKVETFLNFVKVGAKFAYSDLLVDSGTFVFAALPAIFFFGFIIQMLYHTGILQKVILKLGWLLQTLVGTTACESMNAAGNTFLGMTESILLIKPYVNSLTKSEIHTIMCSGFASVSGTTLAAYIGFGATPSNLITATLMAAPASLAFSKLFYPETEKSQTSFKELPDYKSEDASLLDAGIRGALNGIPIVLGITANIIAFTSFVAFLNALLSWIGGLVGYSEMTFEFLLSRIFMPLSWIMGVPWESCGDVGNLIGLKVAVNEFVAYQKLGEYKLEGKLSPRTEAIATFAICGFSNPASLGIFAGALTTMMPDKRSQVTAVAIRAAIAGSIVCFLTACTAGMLMDDSFYSPHSNGTKPTN